MKILHNIGTATVQWGIPAGTLLEMDCNTLDLVIQLVCTPSYCPLVKSILYPTVYEMLQQGLLKSNIHCSPFIHTIISLQKAIRLLDKTDVLSVDHCRSDCRSDNSWSLFCSHYVEKCSTGRLDPQTSEDLWLGLLVCILQIFILFLPENSSDVFSLPIFRNIMAFEK